MQTLNKRGPQTAWAIFLRDEDYDDAYYFHSAHWSRARARELLSPEWKRPKIVKIVFTIPEVSVSPARR